MASLSEDGLPIPNFSLANSSVSSAAMTDRLTKISAQDKQEVRLLLEVSPEVDEREARRRKAERQKLLRKLKDLKSDSGAP